MVRRCKCSAWNFQRERHSGRRRTSDFFGEGERLVIENTGHMALSPSVARAENEDRMAVAVGQDRSAAWLSRPVIFPAVGARAGRRIEARRRD
jgi:hypothetical protein